MKIEFIGICTIWGPHLSSPNTSLPCWQGLVSVVLPFTVILPLFSFYSFSSWAQSTYLFLSTFPNHFSIQGLVEDQSPHWRLLISCHTAFLFVWFPQLSDIPAEGLMIFASSPGFYHALSCRALWLAVPPPLKACFLRLGTLSSLPSVSNSTQSIYSW